MWLMALATSCLAVSRASFLSLLLDISGIPWGPVCPSALVSYHLSCTEDFQAISLILTFPFGPWPQFLTACRVFHSYPEFQISNIEEFISCHLLTFLSVNDHHPPGWRYTGFSCLFYSISNQSLCSIDFLCSHIIYSLPNTPCSFPLLILPAVLPTKGAFSSAYWNALRRSSSPTYKVSLHLGCFSPKHFTFLLYPFFCILLASVKLICFIKVMVHIFFLKHQLWWRCSWTISLLFNFSHLHGYLCFN